MPDAPVASVASVALTTNGCYFLTSCRLRKIFISMMRRRTVRVMQRTSGDDCAKSLCSNARCKAACRRVIARQWWNKSMCAGKFLIFLKGFSYHWSLFFWFKMHFLIIWKYIWCRVSLDKRRLVIDVAIFVKIAAFGCTACFLSRFASRTRISG